MTTDNLRVVDANVLVKVVVDEDFSQQARTLFLSAYLLIAPDTVVTEVTNALLQKVRRGDLSLADAHCALSRLDGLLDLRPASGLLPAALNVAVAYQRSVYDALYVALALSERCQLITGDTKMINAMRHRFGESLVWIGEYPIS